jgi:hypothetical protein
MTDHDRMLKRLTALVKLDIDAEEAYTQAIENVRELDIQDTLVEFRMDHLRHIEQLSEAIAQYGGEIPKHKKDVKGFFIKGMTAVLSKAGTASALMAMVTNETLTNARYRAATSETFPPEIRALVEANYSDEQRHITYIKKVLKNRFGHLGTAGDYRADEKIPGIAGSVTSGYDYPNMP